MYAGIETHEQGRGQRGSMRAYHERRLAELRTARQPWEDVWADVDRLVVPGYYRKDVITGGTTTHGKSGRRIRLDVVDNTGQKAHRTFRSGMQSGLTSKARPWNRLTTHARELREVPSVKDYLDKTTERMREVMNKTNIYNSFHQKYGALGAIGTAVSFMSPDPEFVVRNRVLIAGQYWVATDALGRIDTLYHVMPLTVKQIMSMFNQPGDHIPASVANSYARGDKDHIVLVYHAMEPRTDRDTDRPEKRHKPWLSNYWTNVDKDADRLLRESGSDINRVIGSRWDVTDNDAYGYSLAMDALSDIKQLQHEQGRKLEILDKVTRPPMTGPTAMKNAGKHSLLPGAITYSDAANQSGGYRPAIDVSSFRLDHLLGDIAATQNMVRETFYADLFMMISNMPGVQPRNAFEIAERKEEKLLQLGPALERLEGEELAPTLTLIYHYMQEAGRLPDMPDELLERSEELTVEYTSMLAQAQRAVGVLAVERTLGFVGGMAEANPTIMDKIDMDQAVDIYADRVGTPASIIVADTDVAKIRAERAEQQRVQQGVETAATLAPAAKAGVEASRLLSEIDDTEGDPTRLLDELNLAG